MGGAPSDYIELNRRFRRHDESQSVEAAGAMSFLSDEEPGTGWEELLTSQGVHVILGEAGSGRTYEFQARADALQAKGNKAFFVSLHRLTTEPLEDQLSAAEQASFRVWRDTKGEGWFFLDAVDESKLQRASDFRLALNRFNAALGRGRNRARIFISSRIKDWLPRTDQRHVTEAFELIGESVREAAREIGEDEDESTNPDVSEKKKDSLLQVWTISPLNRKQVSRFAEGVGVADAPSFLQALDDAYAWDLAARPLDVSLLAGFWKKHRRIGHPKEMFEHLLGEQLTERPGKSEYARLYPLSPERARAGAETLAAASILCRRLDFRIADEQTETTGALDACACLPTDWQSGEIHALLSRPVFEAVVYGSTRFRHRNLTEYLGLVYIGFQSSSRV
jgi:hypothetical protein